MLEREDGFNTSHHNKAYKKQYNHNTMGFEEESGDRIMYRGKEVVGMTVTGFPYKGAVSIFEVKRKEI